MLAQRCIKFNTTLTHIYQSFRVKFKLNLPNLIQGLLKLEPHVQNVAQIRINFTKAGLTLHYMY